MIKCILNHKIELKYIKLYMYIWKKSIIADYNSNIFNVLFNIIFAYKIANLEYIYYEDTSTVKDSICNKNDTYTIFYILLIIIIM